eukprot:4569203-Amphidinium_carterae.1
MLPCDLHRLGASVHASVESVRSCFRTRDCLDHWGYTAKDVHSLFELADRDKDGLLDLDEFRDLMHHMKIGRQCD